MDGLYRTFCGFDPRTASLATRSRTRTLDNSSIAVVHVCTRCVSTNVNKPWSVHYNFYRVMTANHGALWNYNVSYNYILVSIRGALPSGEHNKQVEETDMICTLRECHILWYGMTREQVEGKHRGDPISRSRTLNFKVWVTDKSRAWWKEHCSLKGAWPQ